MEEANPRIRPLAVAIVRNGSKILAEKGYDSKKQEGYYRLMGGTIEFAETASSALVREFREELGADITVGKQLKVVQNIFEWEGKKGHEICFVYEAEFADASLYGLEKLPIVDELAARTFAEWVQPADDVKIYPLHPKDI